MVICVDNRRLQFLFDLLWFASFTSYLSPLVSYKQNWCKIKFKNTKIESRNTFKCLTTIRNVLCWQRCSIRCESTVVWIGFVWLISRYMRVENYYSEQGYWRFYFIKWLKWDSCNHTCMRTYVCIYISTFVNTQPTYGA